MKFITIAAVALSSAVSFASASSHFVAYSADHFSGSSASLGKCGCNNIKYNGSYKWYGEGQSGSLYNSPDCKNGRHTSLSSDRNTQSSSSFGWKSVFIQC